MANTGPRPEAISLQWVLGANSAAVFALHAAPGSLAGQRIFYISGNVGVIYDAGAKTQTLLRGHRNPLRAATVDDTKKIIATACAGAQSSIIFWDASNGDPIGMIESPHVGGTSALAFTADGRYLTTLSVAGPAGDAGAAGVQELAIWDCATVWSAMGSPLDGWYAGVGEEDSGAAAPRLCTSAVAPVHDEQTNISISRQAPPAALAVGTAEPIREGGAVGSAFEMVTTGSTSVVFWAATRCEVRDVEAGARMGTTALQASLKAGKKYPTKDLWAIACDAPKVPRAPVPEEPGYKPASGPLAGRTLSQSTFVPGAQASHLSSIDVMAAESKAAEAGEDMGQGSLLTMSSGVSPSRGRSRGGTRTEGAASLSPSRKGLKNPLGTVMLVPPTSARVTAVTATSDGMLLLWQADYSHAESEAAMTRGVKAGVGSGIASVATTVVRRKCLKAVTLKAPNFLGEAPAGSIAHRINTVRCSPSGTSLVIGTEDGGVRVYDLNMRLIGWFEDLAAGPLTALDFVPGTTAAELMAGGQGPQPGLPLKRTLADVPDIVLATRRCMMLGLQTAAFDLPATDELRKGVVLLEGPDSPVTGLATYPHAARLAVAVASGVLQVWDTRTKALLVLRELTRPVEGNPLDGPPPPPGSNFYHPTSLAVDPLGRFVAVGTAEGFLLILSPDDLSDVQAAIAPPHFPRKGNALTRLAFSPDGYHLAAGDSESHVLLYRFSRQTSRRLVEGVAQTTAAHRLASRRPWETVIPESDRFEEVVVDAWVYLGQVQGHSQPITGLAFSHLPPGAVQVAPGLGMSVVPGMDRPCFWEPDTADDVEVARRHAEAGLAQLASVGADRRLCVYDVGGASVTGGLPVRASRTSLRVEQGCRPTCAMWLPHRATCPALAADYAASGSGASLVLPSDAYKLRVWDCEGYPSMSRTSLAPTFGGAISHMALLPSARPKRRNEGEGKGKEDDEETGAAAVPPAPYAIAYATDDRIVGVARLPLDGSPYGYVGVVGHTGPVSAMAASADGSLLFSAGLDSSAGSAASAQGSLDALLSAGSGSVCIWSINEDAVHAAAAEGGTGIAPFLSLLEGGASGKQYSDICDLFSYAQIRAQGESSTAPRRAGVDLPVSELAAVMRGLGYFPTAQAAEAMAAEARAAMLELRAREGQAVPGGAGDTVDLQTLIRLYVNHRPVRPVTAENVKAALALITDSGEVEGETDGAGGVRWGGLARLLAAYGEKLGAEELQACLTGLLGTDATGATTAAAAAAAAGVPLLDDDDVLSPDDLASKVLRMQM